MRFSDYPFGFYELNPFPACNQLVVSNHAFINVEFRGRGQGKKQHVERLLQAKQLGYDGILATVRSDNLVEKAILRKNDWQHIWSFSNNETGHLVELWARRLT